MQKPEQIVISGATGGIGRCLVAAALERWPEAAIYAVGRDEAKLAAMGLELGTPRQLIPFAFDLTQKEGAESLAERLKEHTESVDLVLHTIGVLNGGGRGPEKSLREIDPNALEEAFRINVSSCLWLATALKPFLRHPAHSVFIALSAKVGSIGDNQLGGWFAYRMSKAALNMGIRNISLEFKNSAGNATVVAVHPGTTLTDFSRKFVSRWPDQKVASPEVTAQRLLDLSEKLEPGESGKFLHWDGTELPW